MKKLLLPLALATTATALAGCSTLDGLNGSYDPPSRGDRHDRDHSGRGDRYDRDHSGRGGHHDRDHAGRGGQQAGMVTLTGSVNYRERIALPVGARVTVSVQDISRADAPATVIGTTTFQAQGGVPLPFTLQYDGNRIERGNRYSVSARIEDPSGRRLYFITDSYNALPNPGQSIDLWLVSAEAGRR